MRIAVEGVARRDRRDQLAKAIADIAARIRGLDIAMAVAGEPANVTVRLVRNRELMPTVAKLFGAERAKEIRRGLDPQCLSGFSKNDRFEIVRSDVLLVVDAGDFTFLDCAYEELLQALGPINDTDKVPWTMFNDQVSMGFFDVYDQYLLNILYHPLVVPGMTADEVRGALPQIMPEVRVWVAERNGLDR